MGSDYTVAHAACLAAYLPPESLLLARRRPEAKWNDSTWVLWNIEKVLRELTWAVSGGKGSRPKPLPYPKANASINDEETLRRKADEVAAKLGLEGVVK